MSVRKERHQLIQVLIRTHVVSNQEGLLALLLEHGVRCNQATLSRDLRALGVVKHRTKDGPRYKLDRRSEYLAAVRRVVGMEVLELHHNGVMVVIRTLSGRAEGVAGFLDAWENPEILGTVAGDDTVFVAPAHPAKCAALVDEIRGRLGQEE